MSLTQGGESNLSGRWLEDNIEWHIKSRGIPIWDYLDDGDNEKLYERTWLVRRVPYTSIYGCRSTSEFVLHHHGRVIRIECRVQETPGSVDEKFPYLFLNARDRMPEQEILIVLHGDGARTAATTWMRAHCAQIQSKSIRVLDISGFGAWLKALMKEPA